MEPSKCLTVNKANIHWNLITPCWSFQAIESGHRRNNRTEKFFLASTLCGNFPSNKASNFLFRSEAIPITATTTNKLSHWTNYTNFFFLYQRALLFDFPWRYFEIEINISFSFDELEKINFHRARRKRKSFPLQYCDKRMFSHVSFVEAQAPSLINYFLNRLIVCTEQNYCRVELSFPGFRFCCVIFFCSHLFMT